MINTLIQFPDNEITRAKKFFLSRKPEDIIQVSRTYLDYYKEMQKAEYNPIRASLIPFLHGPGYDTEVYKGFGEIPAKYNLVNYQLVN